MTNSTGQNTMVKMRDTRLDVFRALALLSIFINHVPGTVFEKFTHREFGFSDSAEAFVLISGLAVALAYSSKFVEGNRLLLTLKMARRSMTLYMAQMMTTFITLGIFAFTAIYMKRPELLEQINIKTVMDQPAQAFVGLVTLGHQLGYNNILSLYLVLMLFAPIMLYLSRISISLMLTISGAIWFLSGYYQIAPMNYPTQGVWFLNPLSWQFLFAIGIGAMTYAKQGGRFDQNRPLMIAAIGYLVFSLLWLRVPHPNWDISFGLPVVLTGFDKTYLSATRLLHVLAIAYVIAGIPALSAKARLDMRHPLALLGKHSLPVFIAGTVLAMIGQVLRQVYPVSLSFDTLLIATGILAQFALVYYLEWLPRIGWKGKAPAKSPTPETRHTENRPKVPQIPVRPRSVSVS
ncbi:OpgC family protein [Pseudochrobactrum sp. MP213Fo]|uniref:OpgC family protein n=1 Tax=Pseudochrobactrum sp. MP213Fo TaxID=3022250 RepID=UPI003BA16621